MIRLSNPDINPEFFSAEFRSGLAEFLKIHICSYRDSVSYTDP